jgi:hypothetical protein
LLLGFHVGLWRPDEGLLVGEPARLRCSAGLLLGFHVGLWRPDDGDLVGEPARLRCSAGLLLGFHVGLWRPDDGLLVGEPARLRCSAGLLLGFHVGLWRPDDGDLVGEPARRRCSAGLDDGRHVGLCRPDDGDLVGEPASCRAGAPSCANVFFAPLGPASRALLAWPADLPAGLAGALAASVSGTASSMEFSAGLLLGFHVGLCRPDEGDLDGVPAASAVAVCCAKGALAAAWFATPNARAAADASGAPSCASCFAAPLGPASRVEAVDTAVDLGNTYADEDVMSAGAASSSNMGLDAVINVAAMACSAGLLLGFHVGLWRPDEGDLDGVPASLSDKARGELGSG